MKIKTKEFLDVLNHFKFIFNANNYIKEANCVFFNTSRNIIWCYSDCISYVYEYPNSLKDDFSISSREIALPAKKIFNLIRNIKAEEITVKEHESTFIVKHGRSTSRFACEDVMSDVNALHRVVPIMNTFEDGALTKFRKYACYDKAHEDCANIIFNDEGIISSDNYNFVKINTEIVGEFTVRWDVVGHVIANGFTKYCLMSEEENIVYFTAGNYILSYKTDNLVGFPYKEYFEYATENTDLRYCIYPDKEEDISHIDTFLLNYKKLDKKIEVRVDDKKMMVIAEANTEETRMVIPLLKYSAGESEKFNIISDHFKVLYNDYDYYIVLENMVLCTNIEDNVERLIEVEGL